MSEVGRGRTAVAIGGGTGLPSVLRSLLDLGFETSAVVTMADDGGSSGALRRDLGMLPPGDIRNCLVAMSAEPEGFFAKVLQYRFPGGEGLAGHALGNLILAALTDITGSFPEAIDDVSRLLETRGQVIPSTLADVVLHATDRDGQPISGQARIAANPTAVARVRLEPHDAAAYAPAVEAIRDADVITIGPGSLYTSIIPNFLISEIHAAVRDSNATRVYLCNVANMRGETSGLDAADHVDALVEHGLDGAIDVVIAHDASAAPLCQDAVGAYEAVEVDAERTARIEAHGARTVLFPVASPCNPLRHDPALLREALGEVLA